MKNNLSNKHSLTLYQIGIHLFYFPGSPQFVELRDPRTEHLLRVWIIKIWGHYKPKEETERKVIYIRLSPGCCSD